MTACAIFPSPWEYWVPGMADVKIHSATSNVISPKPAMLNSDHLLSRLACSIFSTFQAFAGQGVTLTPLCCLTMVYRMRANWLARHLRRIGSSPHKPKLVTRHKIVADGRGR